MKSRLPRRATRSFLSGLALRRSDACAAAKDAGLVYLTDLGRGISRRPVGSGFRYLTPRGRLLKEARALARIKALAIPPAWRDVWISPLPNSHLQATGRDGKGRKQYRYHRQWQAQRVATKFDQLWDVGRTLPHRQPRIREDESFVRTHDAADKSCLCPRATLAISISRQKRSAARHRYSRPSSGQDRSGLPGASGTTPLSVSR